MDDDAVLRRLLANIATRQTGQSSITFSGSVDHFEGSKKEMYIVLPAQTTWKAASLWVEVREELAILLGHNQDERDDDNTLHSTLAEVTEEKHNQAWPKIRQFRIERMTMRLRSLDLCRKPMTGGKWGKVASFSIPL